VLKGNFASSVFNIYNTKTQMTQICVTGPQCVNITWYTDFSTSTSQSSKTIQPQHSEHPTFCLEEEEEVLVAAAAAGVMKITSSPS
jgi:hypothetical protein